MGRPKGSTNKSIASKSLFKSNEPEWTEGVIPSNLVLMEAYNYYNEEFTMEELIQFFIAHCRKIGEDDLADFCERHQVKDYMCGTIGKLCRMMDRGLTLPLSSKNFYESRLQLAREMMTKQIETREVENAAGEKVLRRRNKKRNEEEKSPKYLQEYQELSLTSIPWKRIEKSSELWTFNVKTRKLIIYKSKDLLGIKGTTVQNVSFATSKTLRKPEEQIPTILAATKNSAEKFFKAIKSKEQPPKNRLNADTVLLRTF